MPVKFLDSYMLNVCEGQFPQIPIVPGPVVFLVETPPVLVSTLEWTYLLCGSRPSSGGAVRESRRCGILDGCNLQRGT